MAEADIAAKRIIFLHVDQFRGFSTAVSQPSRSSSFSVGVCPFSMLPSTGTDPVFPSWPFSDRVAIMTHTRTLLADGHGSNVKLHFLGQLK